MMGELKPCPFTGMAARGPIEQGNGTWRIFGAGYFIEGPSREIVIAAWNTRPS